MWYGHESRCEARESERENKNKNKTPTMWFKLFIVKMRSPLHNFLVFNDIERENDVVYMHASNVTTRVWYKSNGDFGVLAPSGFFSFLSVFFSSVPRVDFIGSEARRGRKISWEFQQKLLCRETRNKVKNWKRLNRFLDFEKN